MSLATATRTAPAAALSQALDDEPPVWPISIAIYSEMIRLGVIDEEAPVYLWKGRLAERMPPNPPHSTAVKRGYDRLGRILPPGFDIDRERPMALTLHPSVPQPDLAIVRGSFDDYVSMFFPASAVALVVEVADTTLAKDRRLAATYAAEGIPVYWLLNLAARRLEVHSEPAEGAYARLTPFGPEDEVPVILDGREVGRVRVADLLP